MSDTAWTPLRVETLTSLWRDGLSASQVAKSLGGVTRNAVIGKVHRLGLSGRVASGVVRRPAQLRPPRPSLIHIAQSPSPRRAKPAAAIVEPPEGPGLFSRLEHVGDHCCRWLIGDPKSDSFSFCGRPAGDGPYCGGHDRAAHQPRRLKPLAADPLVLRVLAGLAA